MDLQTAFVFLGICIPFVLLTIWGIVDAAQKEFATIGTKVFWIAIASIPFIGFMVYLIFGYRKGKRPDKTDLPIKNV